MLTPKQRRFVDEYLVDLNAAHAAIRAGYSANGAKVAGHRLLTHPAIRDALRETQRGTSERTGVTLDRIVSELAKIGFADIRRAVAWRSFPHRVLADPDTGEIVVQQGNEVSLIDSRDVDDDTAAAIAEVSQGKDGSLRIKLHDKKGALVAMMNHLAPRGPAKGAPADPAQPGQPADDGWGDDLRPN